MILSPSSCCWLLNVYLACCLFLSSNKWSLSFLINFLMSSSSSTGAVSGRFRASFLISCLSSILKSLSLSFTPLISKYFVSSSKSSYFCHSQPVSKGFSGILKEFILSDFWKLRLEFLLVLLMVPSFGIILFSDTRSVQCPLLLIISSFLFTSNLASILSVGFLFSSAFDFVRSSFDFSLLAACIRLPCCQCNIHYAHTALIVVTIFNGKHHVIFRYRMCPRLRRIPQSWLHDRSCHVN